MEGTGSFLVQVGCDTRRSRGSYKTRYSFRDESRALLYYHSINLGPSYKKRLIGPDGKMLLRAFG
jgi:hypothetical protein